MVFFIGSHLSSAKGYLHMAQEASAIGASTFQFFTRNPRGGSVKALDVKDIEACQSFCRKQEFGKILAHAPYTLNFSAKEERIREFAEKALREDLERMEHLPENYYNLHPGSHVGQGAETGIEKIAEILNRVIRPEQKTIVLLETMAGKGTEVGCRFEELQQIIERVEIKEKIGVCLDTCHVYDAGYDIVSDLDGVLKAFDQLIGLDRLKAIHLNDSKNSFGSHKDRHEKIGEGSIGKEAFAKIINHPVLAGLPFFLETPNTIEGYAEEICMLKKLRLS